MYLRQLLIESEQDLIKDIKKILKGGWRLSPEAAIGALVAAATPQTIEDIKRGDMFAYGIIDVYFGQQRLPVKEMMNILQKYTSSSHTNTYSSSYSVIIFCLD